MFSTLNSRLLQRSFLMRLLQTTGLSLALMTVSAAGVRANSTDMLLRLNGNVTKRRPIDIVPKTSPSPTSLTLKRA
jgi:hypothetical protein